MKKLLILPLFFSICYGQLITYNGVKVDTVTLLAGYQTAIGVNATNIALKLNKSDTASMLSGYQTAINLKKNITDSSTTLQSNYVTQYQRKKTSDSITALIACATCVVAPVNPAAGVAHFAGSTQTATSSLIVNADITNSTIDLTTKVTGVLPIANGGTGAATTSQNFSFIGPTSGSGAPSFRALVAGDLPAAANDSSFFWQKTGNVAASGSTFLGTLTKTSLNFRTNNSLRMLIDSVGLVGIGTTAPTELLQVSGATVGAAAFEDKSLTGNIVTIASSNADGAFLSYLTNSLNKSTFNAATVRWSPQTTGHSFDYSAATTIGSTRTWVNAMWINSGGGSRVAGSVGIGQSNPAASAKLDIVSTTQGFLPPRMTTTQRDAISSPAEGLVIYNLTTHKLNVFTTAWEAVTSL